MGAFSTAQTASVAGRGDAEFLHSAIKTLPREALAKLQLRRRQATVKNAYDHVPLQRARLKAAGLRPEDIRSLAAGPGHRSVATPPVAGI